MEGGAKEEEIKKERDILQQTSIDDYLCRFASSAPLTSIHRRSHPYDPGR